jgi:hypothetical protein
LATGVDNMNDYAVNLLIAGGVYHLFFGFFHIAFWQMEFLDWQKELPRMSAVNRTVIQGLNIAVIVFMFLIAYVSFQHSYELLMTGLGKTILLGTTFFWLARLIVEFTLKKRGSAKPILVIAFIIGILLYLLPAVII